jgi:hypothetical protein
VVEVVAVGHVGFQGLLAHAVAQRYAQVAGEAHRLFEKLAIALLRLRARVLHEPRLGPQAPLPAPLVAYDRAHRAPVGIVDAKSLFCHTQMCFNGVNNLGLLRSNGENIASGEKFFSTH